MTKQFSQDYEFGWWLCFIFPKGLAYDYNSLLRLYRIYSTVGNRLRQSENYVSLHILLNFNNIIEQGKI